MKKTLIVKLVAAMLLVTGSFVLAQDDDQAPIPPLDDKVPAAVADTQQSVSDQASDTIVAPTQPVENNAATFTPEPATVNGCIGCGQATPSFAPAASGCSSCGTTGIGCRSRCRTCPKTCSPCQPKTCCPTQPAPSCCATPVNSCCGTIGQVTYDQPVVLNATTSPMQATIVAGQQPAATEVNSVVANPTPVSSIDPVAAVGCGSCANVASSCVTDSYVSGSDCCQSRGRRRGVFFRNR